METKENFIDVVGFEGIYQIGNQGTIRSIDRTVTRSNKQYPKKGVVLKTFKNNRGYTTVWLYNNGNKKYCLLHRIVAESWIKNPQNKPEVNHINGNKDDNRVINLEWVTKSENEKHSYMLGLKSAKGEKNGRAILTEDDVRQIRILYGTGNYTQKELGKLYNIDYTNIGRIYKGKLWACVK